MYPPAAGTAFQTPPVRAICTSDLRPPRQPMLRHFGFCLSFSPGVSEQAVAEGNIPHLRLQVFLEVALAEMEAGEEAVEGWCCCREPREWRVAQGMTHLKNKLVLTMADTTRGQEPSSRNLPTPSPQYSAGPGCFSPPQQLVHSTL